MLLHCCRFHQRLQIDDYWPRALGDFNASTPSFSSPNELLLAAAMGERALSRLAGTSYRRADERPMTGLPPSKTGEPAPESH